MRDSLNRLFQDRFQGHELPVDPGVWQGITQQMATAAGASGEDAVSELFKGRFQGHETPVDPAVWQGISTQLGHTVVATSAGSSFLVWAAAGITAAVVGTAAFFYLNSTAPAVTAEVPATVPEQQLESPRATVLPTPIAENLPVRAPSTPSMQGKPSNTMTTIVAEDDPQEAELPEQAFVVPVAVEPVVVADPLREEQGAAVVESIIQELTTEVKQEVLAQGSEPAVTTVTPPEDVVPAADTETKQEDLPLPKLFMPNTFTPNGDGKNDTYTIGAEGFIKVMLRVYAMQSDRLVFSTELGEPWTGTGCDDGMYLVAVEAITKDGRTATEGMVVWLNRNPMN